MPDNRGRGGRDAGVEAELIRRLARGDGLAWDEVYAAHQGRIFRYGFQMTGSRALADEAVQETFLALLRHPAAWHPERGGLEAWLLGIARNKVLTLLSREGKTGSLDDLADEPGQPPLADQALLRDELWRALHGLPRAYREVMILCDMEEIDYAEAARLLEVPVGTVRSRLHRARQMLAERLSPARQGCPA